jgi:hypothetical protein
MEEIDSDCSNRFAACETAFQILRPISVAQFILPSTAICRKRGDAGPAT